MPLIPPVLEDPIFPESKYVYIQPIIPGAKVTIYDVTDPSALTELYTGTRPVDGWVKLTKQLIINHYISAIIEKDGEKSDLFSKNDVQVQKQLDFLPAPEFKSIINSMTTLVAMSQLVIGATIEIWNPIDNVVVGHAEIERPDQFINLSLTARIYNAPFLVALQKINEKVSEKRNSPPINYIGSGLNLKVLPAAPEVRTNPLTACSREIKLYGIPGLQVSVQNEGFYTNYLITSLPEFTVTDCQPFKEGKLKAVQSVFLPTYTITSESPQFPVGPPRKPDTPHIDVPYCQSQQLQTLLMSDLTPGATITVFSRNDSNQNPEVVGTAYIASKQQSLPVPSSMFSNANVPIGPNSQIAVSLDLCGVKSELSNWIGIGPAYNEKIPFLNPLIDCANFAVLNSCTAGTVIQLWVTNHVGQMYNLLKTPYVAFEGTNIIYFYRSVHKDESIGGYCNFCNNFVVIKDVTVTNDYNKGTILLPIKPGDTTLNFKECVIGSRIEAYYVVNGVTTYINFGYPNSLDWTLQLPKAAELPPAISTRINHISYQFKVFVCDQMITEGNQIVKLGQVKVSIDPPSVYDDNHDAVKISAVDIDYGNSVSAKVTFNDLDIFPNTNYVSGTVIEFNVPKGRITPLMGHLSTPNYEDASFSIAVQKKPVPIVTSAKLTQAEPDSIGKLRIDYRLEMKGAGLTKNALINLKYIYAIVNIVESDFGTDYVRSSHDPVEIGDFKTDELGNFAPTIPIINIEVSYATPFGNNVLNQGITLIVNYNNNSRHIELSTNGPSVTWI